MVLVYPNTTVTFSGSRQTDIKVGYVEISDELYEELVAQKKMWQDGKLVDNPDYEEVAKERERREAKQLAVDEENRLKKQLAETDYLAIKHFEGWISDEDYGPIKAMRQACRDRINELQNSLEESSDG